MSEQRRAVQNLALVDELLRDPATDRMGAMCLGIVTADAETDSLIASDDLLRAVAKCRDIDGAVKLYQAWKQGL